MVLNFKSPNYYARIVTALFLVALMVGLFCFFPPRMLSIIAGLILLEISVYEWPRLAKNQIWIWLIFPMYVVLPCLLFILLNEWGYTHLLILLVSTAAAFDSGAYVVGTLFGRTKLCPQISPGKTWEGVAGGYLAVLLILCITKYFGLITKGLGFIFILAAVLSLFATLGDLSESWLKRRAGLKDSGNILPGHGGLLDRIDSLLLLISLAFIFRNYL